MLTSADFEAKETALRDILVKYGAAEKVKNEDPSFLRKISLWLYDKFGDGEYSDIPGLCKIATRAEIEDKGWSLTPGAYVGVAPVEDDGVDFHERMAEIHEELLKLQEESNRLMAAISRNMEEMGA